MTRLKRYRVPLAVGGHTVLQLDPDTVARDFPGAEEVKVDVVETPESPKRRRRPSAEK